MDGSANGNVAQTGEWDGSTEYLSGSKDGEDEDEAEFGRADSGIGVCGDGN